jgi:alpha-amylase/alpha-mannosidase (GH57 family)
MGYVCIHGHFYQPPRENPWLEAIELQDSAYPYHDWNERINAECYAPNSAARILNNEDQILRILNNYEKISFNFGPTLLSWIEDKAPRVYKAILEADHISKDRFSGHGSAIAQAYHHIILPLANRRDKHTQIAWGIRDFTFRFGRSPGGMWLPETAVDLETLEILAEFGIKFTILAPRQASREGKIGGRSWKDVSGESIDPSMPYRLNLPSGKKISLFFYDGPISRAVAFEDLLANGEGFAKRIMAGFAEDLRPWPELVSVASDGETYGHHHRFGEMALASALDYIESNKLAQLTNYGEYLERHPPIHRVEIFENSSWSCVHGIERWRSNCGCNSGQHPGWSQAWRGPLRQALDWLRDTLAPKYEDKAGQLLKDPWAARNDYIEVILDRSHQGIEQFIKKHALRELSRAETVLTLKLLELQRHAMLMYTSCGWFFDELSGIETVQVMQYAGRVIELAEQVFGVDLEGSFLEMLSGAKSNLAEHGDGARIYEKLVKPSRVDLLKVGSHYAISSIFEPYDEHARVYCYTVDRQQYSTQESGSARLAVGKAVFTSTITGECSTLDFSVAHFGGGHDVVAGVCESNPEVDGVVAKGLVEAFPQSSDADMRSLVKQAFGDIHSLQALFKDQQRKILGILSNSVLAEVEASHRQIYQRHAELMRFLISSGVPLPKGFRASAESALNSLLRDAFAGDELEPERIHGLLQEAKAVHIDLDASTLEFALRRRMEAMAEVFVANVADLPSIGRLRKAVNLARSLPFSVNIWWVQNLCHERITRAYNEFLSKAEAGDEDAQAWISQVTELSEELRFSVSINDSAQCPTMAD